MLRFFWSTSADFEPIGFHGQSKVSSVKNDLSSWSHQFCLIPPTLDFAILDVPRPTRRLLLHKTCGTGIRADFSKEKISELNTASRIVKMNASFSLREYLLDMNSAHVRIYAEASFASSDDFSSQLGFIIFLANRNNFCQVLDYSSNKANRNVRFIKPGEVYAFGNAFDVAYVVAKDLHFNHDKCFPLACQRTQSNFLMPFPKARERLRRGLWLTYLPPRKPRRSSKSTLLVLRLRTRIPQTLKENLATTVCWHSCSQPVQIRPQFYSGLKVLVCNHQKRLQRPQCKTGHKMGLWK